ncbi:hypothetical protein NDR87_21540 [Nocardia sp. CDC159]|uniref:Polyhydroxybutyrate depolymerase n=1 Tax=Nocardia pulmonis TaxID=2951408 RepID=A0A9X2IZX0_9NOCA|nr:MULTISPECIES: PHB depolymerase family esterase [Nocardia]MCM6776530.1 hypothetical protein [Nocardia pulmonis]MCM6788954.1 hypothetical protein [Nocardia sp. CDC159]
MRKSSTLARVVVAVCAAVTVALSGVVAHAQPDDAPPPSGPVPGENNAPIDPSLPDTGQPDAADQALGEPAAACSTRPTGGDASVGRDLPGGGFYRLYVPPGLSGAAPLLVALHGGGGSPVSHENMTGWSGFAKQKKFIVAYPRARVPSPTGGWLWFSQPGALEIELIRSVVRDVAATWCVNPKRVYVEGHSMGGMMTGRMACAARNMFASFGVYDGQYPIDPNNCPAGRPASFAFFAGSQEKSDAHVATRDHRDLWRKRNACPAQPANEPHPAGVLVAQRFECAAGTRVLWRVYDAGHAWPQGALDDDIRNRMWTFFMSNPRP